MARTDYELAWNRLGEEIASKTQHGREGLLVSMQKIAAECRVPEGELARLLRLYSVEVDHNPRETSRDEDPPSDADSLRAGTDAPRTSSTIGGHDGHTRSSTPRSPAPASAVS